LPEQAQGRLIHLVRQTDLARDVTGFLVDRQARGLSTRTVEYYADELRSLQTYLEAHGVCDLSTLTASHLRQYLIDLAKRRNPGGVHCAYRAARAFLRWAWCEYNLDAPSPIDRVKPPRLSSEPLQPLPLSDLKAMLTTCERRTWAGDRDRALLLCLLDTGARASEFVALNVDDVNLSTGSVIIRKGKGGKARVAFLGAVARRELLRWLRFRGDAPGALWTTTDGRRLAYEGLRKLVTRRAQAAGVPVPSLHSFRRAFCLAMLRGGADLVSLSRIMGHADVSLIARYARQVQDDLAAAHVKAGPVDRLL